MEIQIIGIYKVEAEEPCYLIEMKIKRSGQELDIGKFTQNIAGQPKENWQVPYDEHFLNLEGTVVLNSDDPAEMPTDDELRVAFFFHYLDFNNVLKTPIGDIKLPNPKQKPVRLNCIEYESPC